MKLIHNPKQTKAAIQNSTFQEWFRGQYANEVKLAQYQTGEPLITQGCELNSLIFLLEGRVSISTIMANGKRCILRTENAPSLLGEMELLEKSLPVMNVYALEPSRAILLPYSTCRKDLLSDCLFLRQLALLLIRKEQNGTQRLFHSLSYPLENRLAGFILDMEEEGYYLVRKVDAADSLGVSYRHLSEVLGNFVKNGYLEKEGLRYRIKDPTSLAKLSYRSLKKNL